MVPSRDEIRRLIGIHHVPGHILDHSVVVSRVAMAVGSSLVQAGHRLDLGLVESSALLHDICKMECVGTGRDHAIMGREALERYGYPLVADVVGQHVRLRSPKIAEAMVVNYADKRVMHTRVVSLETRFMDLLERYGTDEGRRERIRVHHRETLEVEKLIARSCDADLAGLELLNGIPFDQALYGG